MTISVLLTRASITSVPIFTFPTVAKMLQTAQVVTPVLLIHVTMLSVFRTTLQLPNVVETRQNAMTNTHAPQTNAQFQVLDA